MVVACLGAHGGASGSREEHGGFVLHSGAVIGGRNRHQDEGWGSRRGGVGGAEGLIAPPTLALDQLGPEA